MDGTEAKRCGKGPDYEHSTKTVFQGCDSPQPGLAGSSWATRLDGWSTEKKVSDRVSKF